MKYFAKIVSTNIKEVYLMLKQSSLALLFTSVLVLAACNGEEEMEQHEGHDQEGSDVAVLEVELNMPEDVAAGDAVEISAHVTYDGEDETDADQVEFEILQDEESLDSIVAEHTENGIYLIEYTFEEAGDYEVIAHTDAHSLHTMPKEQLTVTK